MFTQVFQVIWSFLISKTAKRFYWTTLAGFLGLIVVQLTNSDWIYAPMVMAVVAGITKELNNYLSK